MSFFYDAKREQTERGRKNDAERRRSTDSNRDGDSQRNRSDREVYGQEQI